MKNVVPTLKILFLYCFILHFGCENFAQECATGGKIVKSESGSASLPDSPVGIAAQKLINTIVDGSKAAVKDFVNSEMADDMRDFAPMEQHLQIFNSIHQDYSDMEIVGLGTGSQHDLAFMGQSANSGKMIRITLEVEKEAPHRVSNVSFQPNASFGVQSSANIESTEGVEDIAKTVSFYQVPLTCGAAPEIGCGIATKPVLLELQKQKGIKSASLNRPGTTIAVAWKESTSKANRDAAVLPVFKEFGMTMSEAFGDEYENLVASFEGEDLWYAGKEVDKLSMEEASEIGRKVTTTIRDYRKISDEEAEKMESDIRTLFEEVLTKDYEEEKAKEGGISADWTSNVHSIVEKYIGEGNFPTEVKFKFGVRSQKERVESQSCTSSDKAGCPKSCCKSEGKSKN